MRKLLLSLFVVGLTAGVATAQDESFRFFLDERGNDGTDQGARSGSVSFHNPTVAGGTPLYIYLQYGTANQDFSGTNLRFDVSGPATITAGNFYNHTVNGLDRWQTIPNKVWPAGGNATSWTIGSVFKVGGGGFGAKNVGAGADTHFSSTDGSTFGTTLLGTITFDYTAGGVGKAEVKMQNGSSGSAGVTIAPGDFVYFGFDDAAVANKKGGAVGGTGGPTTIADAYITPEPVSLALLGLGALVLRRRR